MTDTMTSQNIDLSSWDTLYIGLSVKYPLFLSYFNESSVLLTYFPKILKQNFMKIRQLGVE